MNWKRFLSIKTLPFIILFILFLIGVIFFTDLMPPIYKEEEAKDQQTVSSIGETKGVQYEKKSVVAAAENEPKPQQPDTSNREGGRYVPPVCSKTSIPYQKVYQKVSWLDPNESQKKQSGRAGYTQVCSPDSNGFKPADITIPSENEVINVGNKARTILGSAADQVQGALSSIGL